MRDTLSGVGKEGTSGGVITTDGDAAGTWVTVRVEGELDAATHEVTRCELDAVAAALRPGCAVSVDLAGLEFSDLGGVAVLRDFVARCTGAGCDVRIEHPPRVVQVIADVIGVSLPFA